MYGILDMMQHVQLTHGYTATICDCHYDVVSTMKWHITTDGYVRSGKTLMHRLVVKDIPEGYEVDHINHNKLDNRCANLRAVPLYENRQFPSTGAIKRGNRWYSTIKRGGNRYALGGFSTREEAVARYKAAAAEYHQTGKITKERGANGKK